MIMISLLLLILIQQAQSKSSNINSIMGESIVNRKVIVNKKVIVKQYPVGKLVAERDLKVDEETIDLDSLTLEPDEVAVQTEAFSVDAFVRTMLIPDAFHGNTEPGQCLVANGYGTVVKAGSNEAYKVGSRVQGMMEVATIAKVSKSPMVMASPSLPGVKPSLSLGFFGLSGLSAYFGVFHTAPKGPCKGETAVISAAAGAVGSIAAQMCKLAGARVVGIAGGPEKKKFLLEELGLDGAVDYKDSTKPLAEQLKEQCPDGIDFFFDNVGGETLVEVLDQINQGSRIVICGAISQYDTGNMYKKGGTEGPSNYIKLAETSSSMSGLMVGHFLASPLNLARSVSYLMWHYHRGNLKPYEHIEVGLESFGKSMEMMFSGGHTGRLVVDVTGDLVK
jgi:NADPH-dependent curcumin reductase CurA